VLTALGASLISTEFNQCAASAGSTLVKTLFLNGADSASFITCFGYVENTCF